MRASKVGDPLTCDAFPEGIPTAILNAPALHPKPYPGENGIMFEEGATEKNEDFEAKCPRDKYGD
jgi:hypothetical protein